MSSLDWLFGLEHLGVKFGLDNITTITGELGHPEREFRSVHIAGTNGKGSVAAMVESGLRAAGYKTGRFTSPHLVNITERFAVDGAPIAAAELEDAVEHLESITNRLLSQGSLEASPTFFEVTTALAFEIFRSAGVQVAVIEVGLGGRLDSTNVLSPTVSVITTIGLDHQSYLGDTLGQVAYEKAGIIKPGTPVVLGRLPPQSVEVIRSVAEQRKAPLIDSGEDTRMLGVTTRTGGTSIARLETPVRRYEAIELPLAGIHQAENAIVAVRTLETLEACGVTVPENAVVDGLRRVSWPGRLDRRRLPGGRELLLDAAHNADGAAALAAFLAAEDSEPSPLVFGTLADKDVVEMVRALAPSISAMVLTRGAVSRFFEPAELFNTVKTAAPRLRVVAAPSIAQALEIAWRISPRIVVAGSLFLVGDVMKELKLS
jgi:dihydrofolate synthase/folylpolyglutamate synthase